MQESVGLTAGKPLPKVRLPISYGQTGQTVRGNVQNSKLKYTERDYIICNKTHIDRACAQERLAERLMDASKDVLDEVTEMTTKWQREVDHTIRERIEEVNFTYDEMIKQKKEAALEVEALETVLSRAKIAVEKVQNAISINNHCCALRENRTGVDLCVDEVEKKLLHELKVMKGAQDILEKTIKEGTEQQRVLRAAIFTLDEDLQNKETAMKIDKHNLTLKDSSLTLNGGTARNYCKYTTGQWEHNSAEAIRNNAIELNSAHTLETTMGNLLKQVHEDLCNQIEVTNTTFKLRIAETTKIKHILEERHSKCVLNISELSKIIDGIEEKFNDKQRSLTLCQLRLSNRSNRPEPESVCDLGQEALIREYKVLQASLCQIKQKLDENNALLRYLKSACLQLEEEINVKANTLNIDEVQCMTYREALVFAHF